MLTAPGTATIGLMDLRGGLNETASFPVTEGGIADLLALLLDSELAIDRIGVEVSGAPDGRWWSPW